MGYHKLPNWRHYWSTSADLPQHNADKLYKLRPMIDSLNGVFAQSYKGTQQLSVDESMILFKGRSCLKQYNPMKPIKRGYKIWCLSDQLGYIMKFEIYQGKNSEIEEKFLNYSLGKRVVLNLTEQEWGKYRIIFFDNYFTSLPLLEKLKVENTLACGTIRSNKKGLPKKLKPDKNLQRGAFDYRFSSLNIGVWKWKDNKIVYLASNYHGNEEVTVSRTQKDGTKLEVSAPSIVKDYNNYMGGVDHADRLRAVYGLDRRSKKWWHRIFWGLIDIVFVNSYVIYSCIKEKKSLLEYRRGVAMGLIAQQKCKTSKRRSLEQVNRNSSKNRRGVSYSIAAV